MGEVRSLPRIEVLFSRPMVVDEEIGQEFTNGPIKFIPHLRGHFEWVTPKALQFLPDTPTPGTKWTCRIPPGTRALDGTATTTEETWQIVYRRPLWVGSWLDVTTPVHDPWKDLFWIEFDRPATATNQSLKLVTPQGNVGVTLLPMDPLHPNRISFRPESPLRASTTHDLVVETDFSFEGGGLPLSERRQLRFRTPGPSRFLQGAFNEHGQIVLHPSFPVPVDSLNAFLRIEPSPPGGFRLHNSNEQILVEGAFPPGESVHLQIRSGYANAFGLRSDRGLSLHLRAPRHPSLLMLAPAEGTLLPGPREFVRLQSENVGDISLRAAWLDQGTYPHAHALREALRDRAVHFADTLALDGVTVISWQTLDPVLASDWPDSLDFHDFVLSRIPHRPDQVQGLWIEATSTAKFDSPTHTAGDTLRTDALLQFGSIGISTFYEPRHALFWITDLITGQPLPNANVSVWTDSSGVLSRSWQGRSDRSGLSWGPGLDALLRPGRELRFVLADHEHGSTWLALNEPANDPSTRVRAAIVTDREQYEPGDLVRWNAYVREVSVQGFTAPHFSKLFASLSGEDWQQSVRVHLNAFGSVSGQFRLPEREGTFVLDVMAPPADREVDDADTTAGQGALLGSRSLVVRTSERPALTLSPTRMPVAPAAGQDLHVAGGIISRRGHGVRHAPVEWSVQTLPYSWTPADVSSFADSDSEPERSGPAEEPFHFGLRTPALPGLLAEGRQRTDEDGKFSVRIDHELWQHDSYGQDTRITFRGSIPDLSGYRPTRTDTITIVTAPLRLGLRGRSGQPSALGALAWEWVCIDTSGTPVSAVEVVASLWREGENGTLTKITERTLVSNEAVQSVSFRNNGVGRAFLRLSTEEENSPRAEAWASRRVTAAASNRSLTVRTAPSPEGSWPAVQLPQTPPAGAQTLWVLHQQELLAGRVLEMSSHSTLSLPTTAALPGEVTMTALQIGSDPSTARHGGAARSRLPRYRLGETSFVAPDSAWKATLLLEVDPESPAPGDTVTIRIQLRDRLGRPCRGEVTLAILESVQATGADLMHPDTDFLDTFGNLFSPAGRTISYADTRQTLQRSGTLTAAPSPARKEPSDLPRAADHSRPATDRTFYWNVGIQVNASGETRLRFPVPGGSGHYRIRAFAATVNNGAGGFAVAEAVLNTSSPGPTEWDLPDFARPGDRFEFAATHSNFQEDPPELRLSGAELSQVESEQSSTDDSGFTSHSFAAKAQIESSASVRFELRSSVQSGAKYLAESQLLIQADPVEETWITFGAAAPKAETILDLDAAEVLGANGLELLLSPTRQSELADAVQATLARTGPGLEPRLSRLRAHLLARKLAPFLPWAVDSLQMGPEANRILWRLAPSGDLTRPLGGPQDDRQASYLDGYAFWTWGELRRHGQGLEPRLVTAFEQRMERNIRKLRSADGVDLDLLAFHLWVTTEHARNIDPDPNLRWLLARDTSLSRSGKLLLALALDARENRSDLPLDPAIERQIDAWMDVFLTNLSDFRGTNGLLHDSGHATLPFVVGQSADIQRTALALRLLARRAPNHPWAGPLFHALLDNRSNGHWGTPQVNIFAAEAVHFFLNRVEQFRLPAQGRVVLGMSRTEGVRFTDEDASPKTLHFASAELARIRRRDPSSPQLELHFETERLQTLAYQLRFPERIAATEAPPREAGLGVFRRYTDVTRNRRQNTFVRGNLTDVEIVIAATEATSRLWLREPRPAGTSFVTGLRELTSPDGTTIPLDNSSTTEELVWVLSPLSSGIHVFRYQILWDRKGEFGIPGSTVSELDAQDRWGRAGANRIRVE